MRGTELRRLRKQRGDSIYTVARAIGVSPAAISLWEAGERTIRPAMAKLLTLYFEGKLQPVEPQGSAKRR